MKSIKVHPEPSHTTMSVFFGSDSRAYAGPPFPAPPVLVEIANGVIQRFPVAAAKAVGNDQIRTGGKKRAEVTQAMENGVNAALHTSATAVDTTAATTTRKEPRPWEWR